MIIYKILLLLFGLFLFSCKNNNCDSENGISNYDSNTAFKDINGLYSNINKDIIIKILANRDTEFLPERGDLIIIRKTNLDSCQMKGSYLIVKMEHHNTLIFTFNEQEEKVLNFIRIAKINNKPVLLIHNSFFNPNNRATIQNTFSTDCAYIILNRN